MALLHVSLFQEWSGVPVLRRVDTSINFNWGRGPLTPSGSDVVSIRWTGALAVPCTGQYNLDFDVDDGVGLVVNGVKVSLGVPLASLR